LVVESNNQSVTPITFFSPPLKNVAYIASFTTSTCLLLTSEHLDIVIAFATKLFFFNFISIDIVVAIMAFGVDGVVVVVCFLCFACVGAVSIIHFCFLKQLRLSWYFFTY